MIRRRRPMTASGTPVSDGGDDPFMNMPTATTLQIRPGTSFGYRVSGWGGGGRARVVVRCDDGLRLAGGLHVFAAPNGAGKTTLLRTLAGLLPPLSGEVRLGAEVHYQSDSLGFDPELSADQLFGALLTAEARARAASLADALALDRRCRYGRLSRGNRAKVSIILAEARLAAGRPLILLQDEPLAGLDHGTRRRVLDLWTEAPAGTTRLVVIHELEPLRRADSLLTIRAGGVLQPVGHADDGAWNALYESLHATP